MGIVLRQGFKNTLFIYLGFFIGGIYTVLLVPKVFSAHPEHWGTARYLVSYAMVIVPWAQLSLPNLIIRYFPVFKTDRKKDFLFYVLFWTISGIGVASVVVLLLLRFWFGGNGNPLLLENKYLIFPILIGFVLFSIGAALSNSYFKSTVPVFFKEFLLRFNVMLLIILYWYKIIGFNLFIHLFALNYLLVLFLLIGYLVHLKAFQFHFSFRLLADKQFRPLYVYAAFSILSTGAAMLLLNIDTLMINHYLSLRDVAIYGPSLFIAGSILIPSRALQTIIAPVVANGWATNDLDTIRVLYKKSAIAPLIISIFLFLLIWINIDLIMSYFGKTFGQGKYIILYLSLGNLVNIATGINGTIINTSKYYRADLYFQLALVALSVLLNIIFIPLYGLNGAALATAVTLASYNTLKSLFVRYRFKMHPFSSKTWLAFVIGISFFVILGYLPQIHSLLVSSLIYTFAVTVLFWSVVYGTRISEDINVQIRKMLNKIG
jgi:O-antigen/teichoic acid export membrane protein